MPVSTRLAIISSLRSVSTIHQWFDSKDLPTWPLPLEVNQRLNIFRDWKCTNDLVIPNLSSDRSSEFVEVLRIREDSPLALCIEQRQSDICRHFSALLVLFHCAFPNARKHHRCPKHRRELSSCLAHEILRFNCADYISECVSNILASGFLEARLGRVVGIENHVRVKTEHQVTEETFQRAKPRRV